MEDATMKNPRCGNLGKSSGRAIVSAQLNFSVYTVTARVHPVKALDLYKRQKPYALLLSRHAIPPDSL